MVIKGVALGLSFSLLTTTGFAQPAQPSPDTTARDGLREPGSRLESNRLAANAAIESLFAAAPLTKAPGSPRRSSFSGIPAQRFEFQANHNLIKQPPSITTAEGAAYPTAGLYPLQTVLRRPSQQNEPFFKNRRLVYSSLWAFASLNYLYADLAGLMDQKMLAQYQTGVVGGVKITPGFLTVAAGFMQIPLANVFLPQVIKNEKTLRWVQIASGTLMTLVQAGTLFAGKPTPYYALFSACEIAATGYITLDAIKWKPNSTKEQRNYDGN